MGLTVADSYALCRATTGKARSSFGLGMKLFPRESRPAILAMYAFFRVTDDIVDADGPEAAKRRRLDDWSAAVQAVLDGGAPPADSILPAVADTAQRYGLPVGLFTRCVAACAEDIGAVRMRTWDELWAYCDGVAGTVGEACLRILGYADEAALALSRDNARAVQLTNIIRDIEEDARRDRVYLPAELLGEHGVAADTLLARPYDPAVRAVARAAAQVARRQYELAEPLFFRVQPGHRPPLVAMTLRYRRLLDRLQQGDFARGAAGSSSVVGLLSAALLSRWKPTWLG